MRAREYRVLEMAIEYGIELGWNRAHKHTDTPDPEQVKQSIHREVSNAIDEWFIHEGEES